MSKAMYKNRVEMWKKKEFTLKMAKNKIPSKQECLSILKKNKTPSNIIGHCKAVCGVAEKIAEKLIKKGIDVNKKLIIARALLHDIERAKDNHIARGVSLLKKLGFPEVAEVIKRHSLYKIENEEVQPHTLEEKIVFYADKRVIGNKVASLKERFDDITKRYNVSLDNEYKFAKKIEAELN